MDFDDDNVNFFLEHHQVLTVNHKLCTTHKLSTTEPILYSTACRSRRSYLHCELN